MTEQASIMNVHQRLHAVMRDVQYIQKEQKRGMNYTIVSHDAVTAKVRPALVEHGVIYYPVKIERTQDGNRTQMDVTVRFVNIDEPSDFIDVACCGYGIDPQDKGPGKATSYAVKYALLKALGLETGDEPDEQNIPHEPSPPRPNRDAEAYKAAAGALKLGLDGCNEPDELGAYWKEHKEQLDKLPQHLYDDVKAHASNRKRLLTAPAHPAE